MSDLMTASKRLFQVNTRVMLTELSQQLNKKATLADIPDSFFEFLENKFDFVYFLGVWQTGPQSRQVALDHPGLQSEYRNQLSDFSAQDVSGSMFAVQDYSLHRDFGGDPETEGTPEDMLSNLRDRLHERGLKLILDFVPNHTGLDHRWVTHKPEMYVWVQDPQMILDQPQNFIKIGDKFFAHGKDPYFDGWTDTIQLNYRHPACREEMIRQLFRIAEYADGIRCDMAMLLLEDVLQSCWGRFPLPQGIQEIKKSFWLDAIPALKKQFSDLIFIAEAYWDKEWELQQQGFDYTYDKQLYDRLVHCNPAAIRGHLKADLAFQYRSVRFLENHDEPRAASVFSNFEQHKAAALITYLVPGLRFFHDGQFEGRRSKVSVQLNRRKHEEVDEALHEFYHKLLNGVLNRVEVQRGDFRQLFFKRASEDNSTSDNFVGLAWTHAEERSSDHSPHPRHEEAPPSSPSRFSISPLASSSFGRSPSSSTSGMGGRRLSTHISSDSSASLSEDLKFLIAIVNYSDVHSQCFVDLMPFGKRILFGQKFAVHDIVNPEHFYVRDGNELAHTGLFLDMAPWGSHVFELRLFYSSA